MGHVFAVMGQKGGTGKSSVAQLLAVENAKNNLVVILVDLDSGQTTSSDWAAARDANGLKPEIRVATDARFKNPVRVFELQADCDLLIIDCKGGADPASLALAQNSDLVILPCAPTAADMRPTVALLHELKAKGIEAPNVVVALVMVSSEGEEKAGRAFLEAAGYQALEGCLHFKSGFRSAQNEGRAFTETSFAPLNREAAELAAAIQETVVRVQSKQAAERAVRAKTKAKVAAKEAGKATDTVR